MLVVALALVLACSVDGAWAQRSHGHAYHHGSDGSAAFWLIFFGLSILFCFLVVGGVWSWRRTKVHRTGERDEIDAAGNVVKRVRYDETSTIIDDAPDYLYGSTRTKRSTGKMGAAASEDTSEDLDYNI